MSPKVTNNTLLIVVAFIAIYFIWGTTYLAVIFALKGFPPFLLSAFRFTTAGLLLTTYCFIKVTNNNSFNRCFIFGRKGVLRMKVEIPAEFA